jgi:hypothetical protein
MHLIPIQELTPGLYWIAQKSPSKGVEHHAILDVGNRMRHWDIDPRCPVILHQTPPSVRRDPFVGTGTWKIIMKIADEPQAVARLIAACSNPIYNATSNNCEHFARYVATGKRESRQVQGAGFIGVLVGIAWAAAA